MEKMFLSVEDVAKILDLDYKTVYRLVLSGQIKAAKIGGVYRIRREEVDNFFDRQKLGAKDEQEMTPAADVASCARCGLVFRVPSLVAGKCQEKGCDAPLCTNCWEKDRYCSVHAKPKVTLSLEQARELADKGELPVFLECGEARQAELTFISRFDQSVQKQKGLTSPSDGSWVQVKDWQACHREEPSLIPSSAISPLVKSPGSDNLCPHNTTSLYVINIQKKTCTLGAVAFSHIASYLEQGYDISAASHAELLRIIESALDLAKRRDTLLVLGIASPTGWEPAAFQAVLGSPRIRGFSHLQLSLCLIDLYQNELKYNPADTRIAPFVDFFIVSWRRKHYPGLSRTCDRRFF